MDVQTDQLWKLLMDVAKIFFYKGSACISAYGITPAQYFVLLKVQQNPNLSQQNLANELRVTKGNISQMLKILGRDGLVVRLQENGKNHMLLTDKSRQIMEKLVAEHYRMADQFFNKLSPDEKGQMIMLLARLQVDA
jgi:DNA-binding MarR family transcriptional regulator